MGAHRAYKAHFHSIFLSLCRLDRIIVVPAFINGDRLVARFIFGTVCPGILAFYPLEGGKKQIEQMFLTLCVMLPPPILLLGYVVRG